MEPMLRRYARTNTTKSRHDDMLRFNVKQRPTECYLDQATLIVLSSALEVAVPSRL